jgi:hypothetical protein
MQNIVFELCIQFIGECPIYFMTEDVKHQNAISWMLENLLVYFHPFREIGIRKLNGVFSIFVMVPFDTPTVKTNEILG